MTNTFSKRGREIALSKAPKATLGLPTGRARHDQAWRYLERVSSWKREHMEFLSLPYGAEVLVWLLKGEFEPRPLKDLYRSSRFSEPTLRSLLKSMVEDGFIVIEPRPDDMRVRTVQLTGKLLSRVEQYLALLRECSELPDQ